MNKKMIALAVAAASLSTVTNAAEVYSDETSSLAVGGRFEARALMKDTETSSNKVTDQTRVRVNIAGKTDITESIYGLGFWEGEYKDGEDLNNRHLNAGIGGDFGKVVYGKTDGSLAALTDFTDIMAYHGNEAGNKIDAGDRTGNNLAYIGSFDLGGNNLVLGANYVFDGDNENTAGEYDVNGYSASAIYAMEMGLAFGAGYGEQDGYGALNTEKAKQAFGAISYTLGDFYVAALYQDAEDTVVDDVLIKDSQGYEFAASYTLGKTVFIATYNYLEDKDNNIDLRDSIAVDATHYFNKNFRTYASYKFNNLDEKDVGKSAASDEFVLGARYDF
ncbi:porin [Photobacterium sp. TY1-4]|uniref:porin n=1 Tax=Photobacterium sp. TY1-4 TaxID=2899122 RepID=UPI0021C1608E|nr:porin [Photobacterium sp. TY1-4]UXI00822.1 porin [Photobacterium sp. TY1-4]